MAPTPLVQTIAAGDSAWKRGDHPRALAAYAEVVRQDPDASSRAVFRLATLLSYDNKLDDAVALYRRYIRLEPQDEEGRFALARALGWAGKYDAALAVYDTLMKRDSTNWEAAKGAARVLAWRGDLAESERRWRVLTVRTPNDASVWVGLGQILRWSDRPAGARQALERALAIDAKNSDALEQLRWANADAQPGLQSEITRSHDSDNNDATFYTLSLAARPPWNGRASIITSFKDATFQGLRGRSVGARARSRLSLGMGKVSVQGELGFAHLSGDTVGGGNDITSPTRLVAALGAHGQVTPRIDAGIGVSRTPFDETAALILNGITMTSVDGDASFSLPARFTVVTTAGWTRVTGGSRPNDRRSGALWLRHAFTRGISVGIGARGFAYDTTLADGYFSPSRYLLSEANVRARFGGDLGWTASFDGGFGNQYVKLRGTGLNRLSERGSLDLGYQFAPGYGLHVVGIIANLPSTSTVSPDGYRWTAIGLSGNILLP